MTDETFEKAFSVYKEINKCTEIIDSLRKTLDYDRRYYLVKIDCGDDADDDDDVKILISKDQIKEIMDMFKTDYSRLKTKFKEIPCE